MPGTTLLCLSGYLEASGFCLERGGRRLLFLASEGGESGCWDRVMSLDLATGEQGEVVDCGSRNDRAREERLDGCDPLVPRSLAALRLTARISSPTAKPKAPTAADLPRDPAYYPSWSEQQLTLSRGKQVLGRTSFRVLAFPEEDRQPRTASLLALGLPGKPFALVTYGSPLRAFNGNQFATAWILLANGWVDGPKLPAPDAPVEATEIPLDVSPT